MGAYSTKTNLALINPFKTKIQKLIAITQKSDIWIVIQDQTSNHRHSTFGCKHFQIKGRKKQRVDFRYVPVLSKIKAKQFDTLEHVFHTSTNLYENSTISNHQYLWWGVWVERWNEIRGIDIEGIGRNEIQVIGMRSMLGVRQELRSNQTGIDIEPSLS